MTVHSTAAPQAVDVLKIRDSRESLVVQVRKALLEAILGGSFDQRLPREDELAAQLKVSRTTVRAAVQELERDGLVTRRRSTGIAINRHVGFETLALQRLVGFDWLLRAQGHQVDVAVAWERRWTAELGESALIPDDLDACVTHKRIYADGAMAVAIEFVVPWAELTVERLPDELPVSLVEFSSQYCHRTIVNAVAQIVPRSVNSSTSTALGLSLGQPFLRLLETHFDAVGVPVAWSVIDMDDAVIRPSVFRAV